MPRQSNLPPPPPPPQVLLAVFKAKDKSYNLTGDQLMNQHLVLPCLKWSNSPQNIYFVRETIMLPQTINIVFDLKLMKVSADPKLFSFQYIHIPCSDDIWAAMVSCVVLLFLYQLSHNVAIQTHAFLFMYKTRLVSVWCPWMSDQWYFHQRLWLHGICSQRFLDVDRAIYRITWLHCVTTTYMP